MKAAASVPSAASTMQKRLLPPEGIVNAVCVRVTAPETVHGRYGPVQKFRFIFALTPAATGKNGQGKQHLVQSEAFVPVLARLSRLNKFLRQWLGRELTESELAHFDTSKLLGKPARLVLAHTSNIGGVQTGILAIQPATRSNYQKRAKSIIAATA